MALIDMMETFQMTNPGEHIDATDVYNSNDNLLDNAYFVGGGSQLGDGIFPINQRGQTSYGGGGTTNVDRWWTQYDTATTLTSAGMRMTGKWDVDQRLPQVLPSGTYTFSVNVVSLGSTGAILQFLDENYQQLASTPLNNTGITSFTLTSDRIRGVGVNMAKPDGSGDITFASMKLEEGTVSTLANDPPPDFGEELAKCQRYLWYPVFYNNTPLAAGITFGQTSMFDIVTPVPMRSLPNIMLGGDWYVALNGAIHTITGVTVTFKSGNHLRVQCSTTDDLGSYNACSLLLGAYQGDNFNAEL